MSTPSVELIYDRDAPHVAQARASLLRAFARAGVPPAWTEWDRKAPESPPHTARYGSPTILVNGPGATGRGPRPRNSRMPRSSGARGIASSP